MSEVLEATNLWRGSLGSEDPHVKRLASALLVARRNIKDLLSGIPGDMKGYTVHDVSHLDALWEIADLIAGTSFQLNPAEAFVFGIAVLLHDSAMSVMAYPGGIDELSKTHVWEDQARSFGVAGQDISSIPSGVKESLVTNVLRVLHAQQAEKLATQTWSLGSKHFHIVEDDDLRNHYGPIAGKIAHSHHWDASSLPTRLSLTLGSFGDMPSAWTIDTIKVASLLRCADAAHIDHRRAPRRLFAMSKPVGISETHWNFQSKLAKPYVLGEQLHYSSIDPFGIELVDAWYLCFETAQMVDRELADALENLRSKGCAFAVTGVHGVKSVSQFAENVRTTGWKPVGVDVQVSDVPSLAKTLGGEALYSTKLAPIRELIQNAADSIDARAQIDPDFSKEKGAIVVRVAEHDGSWRIDVEDNGIGMSERVLTRALLDFGKSFWRSELVRDEYPEVRGGFHSARGKFGIGFFSVFMWSKKVTVVSRKFSGAQADTMALEFLGGISQRPILREAHPRERSSGTMTRISMVVDQEIADLLLGKGATAPTTRRHHFERSTWDVFAPEVFEGKNPIGRITAALDIDVYLDFNGSSLLVNNRNWASLEAREFIEYFSSFCGEINSEEAAPLLSEIVEDGLVRGRALLVPPYLRETETALLIHDKGITVRFLPQRSMFGVLEGSVQNAARDRATVAKLTDNESWMDAQQAKVFVSAPDAARQVAVQKMLVSFRRFAADQILFVLNREMISLSQVLDRVASSGQVEIRISETRDDEYEWKEITSLDVIVGLKVNPTRLFVLCDLPLGQFDESSARAMFSGGDQDSVAGKVFAEIGRTLGNNHLVRVQLVDQDSYSKRQDLHIVASRSDLN